MTIHFCGEDGRPLCGRADGEGWLWTVTPEAITCAACAQRVAERGRERAASMATAHQASSPQPPLDALTS